MLYWYRDKERKAQALFFVPYRKGGKDYEPRIPIRHRAGRGNPAQQPEETPHAVFALTVTHRTAAGVFKQEQYPVHAWRGTALQLMRMVQDKSRVSISGYLIQRTTPQGIEMSITISEFQVSGSAAPVAALQPRSAPRRKDSQVLNPASQAPAQPVLPPLVQAMAESMPDAAAE